MRTMRALLPPLAVLWVFITAGCGAANENELESVSNGTETVTLSVDHRSEWRKLWIEGTTDLPDGAFVNYSVTHELGETTPCRSVAYRSARAGSILARAVQARELHAS